MQRDSSEPHFAFDKVLFLGRTLAEYKQMFNLDVAELRGQDVLDCPGGPASFVAEARQAGIMAIACDPMYGLPVQELGSIVASHMEECLQRQAQAADCFDEEKPRGDYAQAKLESMRRFLDDYPEGLRSGRYVRGELPSLPFANGAFAMTLSSNFLFLYSDFTQGGMLFDAPFDYRFHLASILEMMRVSRKEARIYPVTGPHKQGHDYLDRIVKDLPLMGLLAELVAVPYRDVKGAHHMLRVRHQITAPSPTARADGGRGTRNPNF